MSAKREIAVGMFFFAALSILGYFTIIMSAEFFEFHEYYPVTVIFSDIEGLGYSDKVKINGVTSGTVEDIKLKENNKVWVKLKMYNRFTMYENFQVKIKNETALGGKFISINPGTLFYEGQEMALVSSRENLKGESLDDLFGIISEFVAENRDNVRNTIKDIREIVSKINTGQGTLGKLINEAKVHDDTDQLVKELRDTIEDVREQAPVTSFIRAALLAF